MLVALSVMSVTWMFVIAALVLAQKLLPPKAAIDVPLALAIVGFGLLIVTAPSSVPELTPPTSYVIGGAAPVNLLEQ
jgi:predicted metal-binding membrane protein